MGGIRATPRKRFARAVALTADNGCWTWTLSRNRLGYGRFGVTPTRVEGAHRFAYAEFVGPITPGLVVMHRCDNPACVRPSHLALGTQAENLADMHRKGRSAYAAHRGEDNGAARLTQAHATAIRGDVRASRAIAREYGISKSQVLRIRHGESWSGEMSK